MSSFTPVRITNLAPGAFVCGFNHNELLFTVLGSCVSLIIWHPARRFYAMCHYVNAQDPKGLNAEQQKGYYADQILPYLLHQVQQHRLPLTELEICLAGAATSGMSRDLMSCFQVAQNNLKFADHFLSEHSLRLVKRDVGGEVARQVKFCCQSGKVEIRQIPLQSNDRL